MGIAIHDRQTVATYKFVSCNCLIPTIRKDESARMPSSRIDDFCTQESMQMAD